MSVRIRQTIFGMIAIFALPAMAITNAPAPATVSVQSLRAEVRAKTTLRDVASTASQAADLAFLITQRSASPSATSPQVCAVDLMNLRDRINQMGRDLQSITTGAASLPPWQQQAVDLMTPLLRDAAGRTDDAIRYCGESPETLWTSPFRNYTMQIRQDSERISKTVRSLLQYDHFRDRELQVEERIWVDGI